MAQADRAIESLYEDAGLLDELVDSDAQLLMQWAEKQIETLAGRNLGDAEFDAAMSQLRQLLTRINRYVGRHAYLTPDEQHDWMTKIVESASALGYNIPIEQMSAQVTSQAAPDSRTLLTGLLQMMDSAKTPHGDVGATWQVALTEAPPLPDSDTGDTTPDDEKNEPQE
jgi:hypothetical protein